MASQSDRWRTDATSAVRTRNIRSIVGITRWRCSVMILLNPEGSSPQGVLPLAPRPGTLKGKTIGLLSNSKLNADAVLSEIGELLAQRYDVKAIVHHAKSNFSLPAPDATMQDLISQCDIVLAGVGD